MTASFDYIVVGGGLQGGLLCLALKYHQPHASVLLVDEGEQIGGNHTWSFHESDIQSDAWEWLAPVITSRWNSYTVRFPGLKRMVPIPYASIDSRRFRAVVEQLFQAEGVERNRADQTPSIQSCASADATVGVAFASDPRTVPPVSHYRPNKELRLKTRVDSIDANAIYISNSKVVGNIVVDCRGPAQAEIHSIGHCGYQSFHGFELELDEPWPEQNPVVMDCCENQTNGFRFTYALPFNRHRVLIEDTRFANNRDMNREESLHRLSKYVTSKTESAWQVIREESGCLPMPWNHALLPTFSTPFRGGYAGGWFHAATGYSLPLAANWADVIARNQADRVGEAVKSLAMHHQSRAKQTRFLNRLLFRLVEPERRYEIFRRFYRVLSPDAITRFYAHQFTKRDLFKILIGRPPSRLTPCQFISSFASER